MGKRIVVLGAGESGVGAAVLAKKNGYNVFLSDSGKIKDKYKKVLLKSDIEFEEGKHTEKLLLSVGEIIKSPGIPDWAPVVVSARKESIAIISEIEFGGRFTDAKKICITGSNGKTTTTLLTWHILKNAGLNVGLGGNVGKSFAWQVAENNFDYYVLELSSFQLDGMFNFKADIAVLLNITPDHLDRYDNDFGKYSDSKFRIIRNQTVDDAFIYCQDDPVIAGRIKNHSFSQELYPFSIKEKIQGNGAFLETDIDNYLRSKINITTNTGKMNIVLQDLALKGSHNVYNSMAGAIASRLVDIRREDIKLSLLNFQNAEHRLEFVASVRGVEFINDSKATNVNSTWYGLETVNKPVIWIAGGQDKGNDYSSLVYLVRSKVKAIICLSIDNRKIHKAFKDHVATIIDVNSADEAVKEAYSLGCKGDTVLLSPACASFDLFENYEDRGNQFKKAVINL